MPLVDIAHRERYDVLPVPFFEAESALPRFMCGNWLWQKSWCLLPGVLVMGFKSGDLGGGAVHSSVCRTDRLFLVRRTSRVCMWRVCVRAFFSTKGPVSALGDMHALDMIPQVLTAMEKHQVPILHCPGLSPPPYCLLC